MPEIIIPKNAREQSQLIFPYDRIASITHTLHLELLDGLIKQEIPLIASMCRTKPLKSLVRKIGKNRWLLPIYDIHGLRIVTTRSRFEEIVELIRSRWHIPDVLPGEIPAIRDHRDLSIKAKNSASLPAYDATHLNFVIPNGARVAEVQLFTAGTWFIADSTRTEYQQRRRLSKNP